ncbi:MAG: hypothetical protein J5844_01295, partial [Clostridia bacterium]|nr:hypothetical protein [Clostridia bacterium]
ISFFALILLLLLMKYTVIVSYDKDFSAYLKIGLLKLNIKKLVFGKKKKKAKKIKFDGNFDLLDGKIKEKPKKDKNHKFADGNDKEKTAETGKNVGKKPITEVIQTYTDLFSDTFSVFAKYAKLKVSKLKITVSSPEPDKTALLFGNANTAMSAFLYVCRRYRFLEINEKNVGIYSDFLENKPKADVKVSLSLLGYQALICAVSALNVYNKIKNTGGSKYGKAVNE